jgi:putative glutamine amidotransferase
VVPDIDLARNRGVDFARYYLYAETCDRLYEAGALPLVLPYAPDADAAAAAIDAVDALVLIGGDFDIDPHYFGEQPHPDLGTLKPDRTRFELELFRLARARRKPLLGICGGMQLINVACGGKLFQHLPAQRPDGIEHTQKHSRKVPSHPVEVQGGTRLAAAVGAGALEVNSTHHQAVKEVGEGLIASASASDGLVEAVEHREAPFCVGVQWHPETLERSEPAARHLGLFRDLVAAARADAPPA